MKTALKSALTATRRALLWFQIRSLEINIYGMNEVLSCIRDPLLEGRIIVNRSIARRELARVRGEYIATLPPGRRVVWSNA
jgi:hypothetical protein